MLSPNLRLLVRHQARSAPLQLQRRLDSEVTRKHKFADFLGWAREHHGLRQGKHSHWRSGSAQGGKSSKKKKQKITGQKSPRSTHKNPLNAMTREQRILKTVLDTVRDKRPPTAVMIGVNHWPTENWGTDGWGLDSKSHVLKPWHRWAD